MDKATKVKVQRQDGDASQLLPNRETPANGKKPKVAKQRWISGKQVDDDQGHHMAKARSNSISGSVGSGQAANPETRRVNSEGEDEYYAARESGKSLSSRAGYGEKPLPRQVEKKMAPSSSSSNSNIIPKSDKISNHKPVIVSVVNSHSARSKHSFPAAPTTNSNHSTVREHKAVAAKAMSQTNSPQPQSLRVNITTQSANPEATTSEKGSAVQMKREKHANHSHTQIDDRTQTLAHYTINRRQAVQNTSLQNNIKNGNNPNNTTNYKAKTNNNTLNDYVGEQQQEGGKLQQPPPLLDPATITTPTKSASSNDNVNEQAVPLRNLNRAVQRTRNEVAAEPTATTTMGSQQQQQQEHSSPLKRRRRLCIDSNKSDEDEYVDVETVDASQHPTEGVPVYRANAVMQSPGYISRFFRDMEEMQKRAKKSKANGSNSNNKSPNGDTDIVSQQPPQQHLQQQTQQTLQLLQQRQSVREINIGKKIPILFLPKVPDDDIVPFTNKLLSIPAVGAFKTRLTASNGLRVISADMETYEAIHATLAKDNVPLHTHQPKKSRGLRVIIRKLHQSTPCEYIKNELKANGFNIRFIRRMKHRFTGKPLNLIELEVEPSSNGAHLGILKIESLGNQAIAVERMAKPRDPVQCYRCQAFGHTRNYCCRPYRCMKCAGDHESKTCKKPKQKLAKCANCGESHVSSYKGCVKYKIARDQMRANKVIGGVIYKQHPRQQQYKHQLQQQRRDQRNHQRYTHHQQQQQHHLKQQQPQQNNNSQKNNVDTNTAGNRMETINWYARKGNGQQQKQQPLHATTWTNKQKQRRSPVGQKEQQQQQRHQQQQFTQQPATNQSTPTSMIATTAIAPPIANSPITAPEQQKLHRLAAFEAKLNAMLEVLENLVKIKAGTLKPCESTSPRSDPVMETDACYYK